MRAPILPFPGGYSVPRVVYMIGLLVVDVAPGLILRSLIWRTPNAFLVLLLAINEALRFVKIVLSSHATLSLRSILTM